VYSAVFAGLLIVIVTDYIPLLVTMLIHMHSFRFEQIALQAHQQTYSPPNGRI